METNEKYNYELAMIHDIIDWLHKNHWEEIIQCGDFTEKDYENILKILWTEDSVTGNASGSYWFSTWKAEEALCHNWDLAIDALQEFGWGATSSFLKGAEWVDVTIRCYLLQNCLDEAIEMIEHPETKNSNMEFPF